MKFDVDELIKSIDKRIAELEKDDSHIENDKIEFDSIQNKLKEKLKKDIILINSVFFLIFEFILFIGEFIITIPSFFKFLRHMLREFRKKEQ